MYYVKHRTEPEKLERTTHTRGTEIHTIWNLRKFSEKLTENQFIENVLHVKFVYYKDALKLYYNKEKQNLKVKKNVSNHLTPLTSSG